MTTEKSCTTERRRNGCPDRRRRRAPRVMRLLLALGLLECAAATAATPWRLGNEASFYRGKYGTSNNIDIFYDATYLKRTFNRLKLKITIPYEQVSGLPVGGAITGSGHVVGQRGTGSVATTSASGLGDIWVSGRYSLIPLSYRHPSLAVYSKVKLPTASHASGLGTGKLDYEAGVGTTAFLSSNGYPFADVGYRVVGSPANIRLRNIFTYDAGYSYVATKKNVLTAMFSGTQSEQRGQAAPADLIFAWNYRENRATGFEVFFDKGLSNGSPDYGVGVGAHLNF